MPIEKGEIIIVDCLIRNSWPQVTAAGFLTGELAFDTGLEMVGLLCSARPLVCT
jgi:hypothetical protein